MSDLPAFAKPQWKLVNAPFPQPGPVRASERIAIKRARRPSLFGGQTRKGLRRALLKKYGRDHWRAQLKKIECRKSLKAFVIELWDVIEPGTPLVWNWHLDVICEVLERITARDPDYRRVVINVPPGHMKSLLVSVCWPAWQWLENPGYRALFITYVQKLSNDHSRKCRDLIRSKKYQDLIPRVYGEKWDQPWEMKRDFDGVEGYGTTLSGTRVATSFDGAATGLRGDDIIIDDPMNADEFPTAELLDGINSTFDKRLSSRFNDMTSGAIVIIMQRLHENDLSGHVLAKDAIHAKTPGWVKFKHVCLRSEYDPDAPNEFDKRTERGQLLFPARFPRPVIENAKIDLGAQFFAQHDQRPVSAAGGIFPMAKICFWYPEKNADGTPFPAPVPHREKDATGNEVQCKQGVLPRAFDTQIQSWDLAFKDLKTSDFVAGQVQARRGPNCYLIDQMYGHFGFSASCDAIRTMSTNYPFATAKYVEDKANGPAVIEVMKRELFGIEEVDPDGGKQARAWAIEPLIAAGNMWLPHPACYPWVHKLLAEMRAFPKAKNDDQVDALTQGMRKLMMHAIAFLKAMTRM